MRIRLYTDKRQNKQGEYPVRLSVSFAGRRFITTLGCSMTANQFETFLCAFENRQSSVDERHTRQDELLHTLRTLYDRLSWEAQKVRRGDISADDVDVATLINTCKGKVVKNKATDYLFSEVYVKFMVSEQKKKDLSEKTVHLLNSLKNEINRNYPGLTMSSISTARWVERFIEDNVARCLSNTTIRSKYRTLHWFLMWAYRTGFCGNDFMSYRFELKIIESREKQVVFLTMDEIRRIQLLNLPPHIDIYRDMFLFQCFTGLRYSDLFNLRNANIQGDLMTIVTHKTGVTLQNKLNKYALSIVDKYRDRYGERLFPSVSLTNINHFIKTIGRLAGIDDLVTRVEYRNHRRVETCVPKWQLLSSHVGRKTFVVNSLDMGLTATQVIGYTGHSSITAMQPYISISQKKKDAAMDVWNSSIQEDRDELTELKNQIEVLQERLRRLSEKE